MYSKKTNYNYKQSDKDNSEKDTKQDSKQASKNSFSHISNESETIIEVDHSEAIVNPKVKSKLNSQVPNSQSTQSSQPQNQDNSNESGIFGAKVVNQVFNVACCLIIALGIGDIISGKDFVAGMVQVSAGILLMPGVMNWNFASANRYQKILLIAICLLYLAFTVYLISFLFRKTN